jgi:hypothetical protein
MTPLWPELRQAVALAQQATAELAKIGHSEGADHLRFTLDGRLVGDIGELIAVRHFDIDLHKKQQGRHDGICRIGSKDYGVQIKCRVRSWVFDFTSQPDLLLVIWISDDWQTWDVLYNGPGTVVTSGTTLAPNENGRLTTRRRLRREHLEQAMRALSPSARRVTPRSGQTS